MMALNTQLQMERDRSTRSGELLDTESAMRLKLERELEEHRVCTVIILGNDFDSFSESHSENPLPQPLTVN